jgi:putative nucleotidyltransferase with HDIG domain
MQLAELKAKIPHYVFKVAEVLSKNGYEAFLVGGAVRDVLLGREPKDFDLATNALPEQMEQLFTKSVTTNAKFGTVLVIIESETGERFDVEVTTYRREEEYIGGRWPAKVEFTTSIVDDLSRRDFTINAIAINLSKINETAAEEKDVIVDPFNGRADLEQKLLRAVGDPLERFGEDGLRSFKACRLASELGFSIDPKTFAAMKQTLHIARQISVERIRDEFLKLINYSPKPSVGIELLRESGLLELFLPELLTTIGLVQPDWHSEDVYLHSLRALDLAEDSIKIAALLHDIGKPKTRSEDENGVHFYSHDVVGAELVAEILTRLRFPKAEVLRNKQLVRWHMFYYPSADWRRINAISEAELKQNKGKPDYAGWTDGAIRRFIKNVGEDLIEDLFKLRIADATSNPKSKFQPVEIQALEERIAEVRAKDMVIKISDLDISGDDLKLLGITPGPAMGKILNQLLERVIDQPILNEKSQLLKIASEIQKES